ncbi:MAG: polyphosphate:AMP phosphotransferase [Elusimicrobiota bacterium]
MGGIMFEIAELGIKTDKETFDKEVPKLRLALLEAQKQLSKADFSVALLVSGVEGAGKTQLVNLLVEWMDARGVEVHAPWEPSDEEKERPRFWRYWRMLPPKGKMAVFLGSWYSDLIVDRVFHRKKKASFYKELGHIKDFETLLADEKVLVVKLWLHLSKKDQRRRFNKLEKDPETRWRVTAKDWRFLKRYDRFREVSEQTLRKTGTAAVPWQIVEAADRRHTALTAAKALIKAINNKLKSNKLQPDAKPTVPRPKPVNILRRLDFTKALSREDYDKELPRWQGRLADLTRRLRGRKKSVLLLFEGPDAAGKGGSIRRMTRAMDARLYRVISTSAPDEIERAHPYLWRFWRDLPRTGRMAVYDRSWYGRVLVERLEGFCSPDEWTRAYGEINAFEEQLTDFGIILLKFWIAITPQEQLQRFKDRNLKPYKQYKLTEEDWRNRKKWDAYEAAACDMIEKTSTDCAPWTLVEGNDKRGARIKVIRTVVEKIDEAY